MAKYDWKQLEKEYILSNYKSVSSFLKDKGIKANSSNRKKTIGWKEKRGKNVAEKGQKTIEKVTEKESEKEAQQIVDIKSIASDLALNILRANKEANLYIDKSGEIQIGLIDKKGLKQLTSALKDISDILNVQTNDSKENDLENAKEILIKIREVAKNDEEN